MRNLFIFVIILSAYWSISCQENQVPAYQAAELSLIPRPASLELDSGAFIFDATTAIGVENPEQAKIAGLFTSLFLQAGSWTPAVVLSEEASIRLITRHDIPDEGYQLTVTPHQIEIHASGGAGFFYAFETLKQLLPPAFYSPEKLDRAVWSIPCVRISDAPSFPWRGYMLDVSRHFFDKQQVKQVLDMMAQLKLNRFHWHLTDDQGWRLEIKGYPKLTEVGAWRVDYINYDETISDWWGRPPQKAGEQATYGGFYTQEDVREIVAYAEERYIEILPEIDMPGHAQATIAAYPQIGCVNAAPFVATGGVFKNNTYNPGKEETYKFIEEVLEEVMELFPFEYLHIGGDECNKEQWKTDPHAQALMRKEGLENEEELQSYFIQRVERIINRGGRRMIGWDEILQGGLAPNATVMSWRGEEGGIEAAQAGHDVIMTPSKYCYLDLKQGPDDLEPNLGYAHMFLKDAYEYKIIPAEIDSSRQKHILGTQANLWTESITDWGKLNYMTYPRIYAIAENAWTPEAQQHWNDFSRRLDRRLDYLDTLGIRYATSAYNVNIQHQGQTEGITFSFSTEVNGLQYFYTTDRTEPDTASILYEGPFLLSSGAQIKARAFQDNQPVGKTSHLEFPIHLGPRSKPLYHTPYLPHKDAAGQRSLVDHNYAAFTVTSDHWQGFDRDMEVDFHFPNLQSVSQVQITTLRMTISGIYVPEHFQIWGSTDGSQFQLLAESEDLLRSHTQGRNKVKATLSFRPQEVRVLKFKARSVDPIPAGHHRAGESSKIYIDEVVIL